MGWSAAAAAAVVLVWLGLPAILGRAAALVPVEWEVAIGEATVEQLVTMLVPERRGGRFCTGEKGVAVLRQTTERLAATVDSPYTFTVRIADSKRVNAFAAPGGHIVFMRGLLDEAESPEEVAGVLAHEMGHVIERHGTEAVLRHMGLKVILEALLSDPSSMMPNLGEAATLFLDLSYSREAESEADAVGLEILRAAGIRSDGLVAFFERIAEEHGDLPEFLGFLATHPATEARAEAARAAVGRGGPAMSPEEWTALKDICAGKSG